MDIFQGFRRISTPYQPSVRSWIIKPSRGHHLAFLDGIRAIAILMVVACHSLYVNPGGSRMVLFFGRLFSSGALGVPVFFVLSGFVISLPFVENRLTGAKDVSPWNYIVRRAAKILPPFYLSLVLFTLFYFALTGDTQYGISAMKWAVGIPHFVQQNPKYLLNGSYWSLVIEVQFYTVLPLLFWMTRGIDGKKAVAIIFLCFQLIPLISRFVVTREYAGDPDILFYLKRFPGSLDTFSWGILFAAIYVSKRGTWMNNPRTALAGYCGIVLVALSLLLSPVSAELGWSAHASFWITELLRPMAGVGTFLVLFFCFSPSARGARLLSRPVLMFIGLVSYEWFIFHQPVVDTFRGWMGSSHGSMGKYGLTVITPGLLTLAFSALVYRFFSMPLMQWARTRLASSSGGEKQQKD